MFRNIFSNYSNVIVQVVSSRAVLEDLPDKLLELFCGHVDTKEKSLVPVQAVRCCEGGDVS